ncbi:MULTISPECIES: LacI family DNA-binding transcriptional regulator [unclassified Paracoccus (in: a-proteobacteria)]|uniref:LacI family DNA-binding transcriptional regulator n=1 Tax=unclassified Paracoccus (in: a-proteobacteria) TaxID=2688777 RepID=UPI001603E563|nr:MULTISPECIES: LacI family DNA-binding transcriptional regulator [unclassified Paracoccus (in: a-proteobacteria)]MBB1491293.1 LacI family DNA-binding transcriptional regulator [Paracoccus sp. MC1854]MBB1498071.1 LacI family DNA-binding transcriptional regulator [Paracoccus sp. MC1862]QQO43491.1 LacI family DNA-binding transcriptional regulator [Paracoccus sp. MC1862]
MTQDTHSQVRLTDVARRAGVSPATVSRVLSRPELVSPAMREAVMQAVTATGYRMNQAARNLRKQRTGAVVALVPNLGNPFFAKILAGMGQELNAAGFDLLVGDTMDEGGRHRALDRFLDPSRADGIILLDGQVTQADLAALPQAPPLVMACEWIEGSAVPCVVLDNALGTELAARHLRELGHQRIGWIGGPPGNVLHKARLEGLARVLGKVPPGYPGDFSLQSGTRAAQIWLAGASALRPTAIVAFSDELAAGFMGEVQRHGVVVPRDVSVIGFDGIEWVAHLPTPLTTIRQPKRDLGRTAARTLIRRINGEPIAAREVLRPELVLRASTAPPA